MTDQPSATPPHHATPNDTTARSLPRAHHTPPPLGHHASRGIAFMLAQVLGTKGARFLGQIALGWLLLDEDFGAFALAATVTAFTSLIQSNGVRDVLVHRGHRAKPLLSPAVWYALSTGLLSLALAAALSPLAARWYHEPQLVQLILLLGLASLLDSTGQVPRAVGSMNLRFGRLALIESVVMLLSILLQVLFAWLGWGAAALAAAYPLASALRAALFWRSFPLRVRPRPQIRRWRLFVPDASRLLACGIAMTATYQGDYVLLRAFFDTAAVGLYFIAYNLSTQSIALFVTSLESVLFPSLAKLRNDPSRQARAFVSAVGSLAVVVVPACILQALLAPHAVRALYPERLWGVGPLLALLSVGMVGRAIIGPCISALNSAGRFRDTLSTAILYAAAYLTIPAAVAFFSRDPTTTTAAFAAVMLAFGVVFLLVVTRGRAVPPRDCFSAILRPAAAAGIAAAAVFSLDRLTPPLAAEPRLDAILRIAALTALYAALCLPAMALLAPRQLASVLDRAAPLLDRTPPGRLIARPLRALVRTPHR